MVLMRKHNNRVLGYDILQLIKPVLFLSLVFLLLQPAVAQQIKMADELVVAVPEKFPPYYSVNAAGRPQGFAIDVFDEVAERQFPDC